MRPLPDLTPLVESPSVYQAPRDSFLSIFADNLNEQDALTKQMTTGHNQLAGSIDPLYTALNGIVTAFGAIVSIFDTLSKAFDAVDLTSNILEYQSFDGQLESNLNSWAPDIAADAAKFLVQILEWVGLHLFAAVVVLIQRALSPIIAELADLYAQIFALESAGPGYG